MRLLSLTLTPENPRMEKVLFDRLPFAAERFWPLSLLHFQDCKSYLEDQFPVRVQPSIPGWGQVRFSCKPRALFVRIRWENRDYSLTADGCIWPASQDLEQQRALEDVPLLEWGEQLPPPFVNDPERVVLGAALPVENIRKWIEELGQTPLFMKPLKFRASRRIGGTILEIGKRVWETEVYVSLPEDTRRWPQLFKALDVIIGGISDREKWVRIDATYGDKIVVKRDTL